MFLTMCFLILVFLVSLSDLLSVISFVLGPAEFTLADIEVWK
jgi:hypothetical protein